MTISTQTGFDLAGFSRAYATWDIPAILDHYDDSFEWTMITADNPPSNPLVQQGKEPLRQMFEHGKAAGVQVSVDRALVTDTAAALTFTCRFPNGHAVVSNAILGLVAGRVVSEHEVLAGG